MAGPDWTKVTGVPPTPRPATVSTEASRITSAARTRRKNQEARDAGIGIPYGQNPMTSEVDYAADEVEFMKAVERYKREHRRPFPTTREILAIVVGLGYKKVAEDGTVTDVRVDLSPKRYRKTPKEATDGPQAADRVQAG